MALLHDMQVVVGCGCRGWLGGAAGDGSIEALTDGGRCWDVTRSRLFAGVTGPGLDSMPPMISSVASSRPARMPSDNIPRVRGNPPAPGMGRHLVDWLSEPHRTKLPILALHASTEMPISQQLYGTQLQMYTEFSTILTSSVIP